MFASASAAKHSLAGVAATGVRLWKTTAFDLKRELYVIRQIEKPVKGIVVLRG